MRQLSLILCILWMGFIFHMSSIPKNVSNQQSMKVTNYYKQVSSKLKVQNIIDEKKLKQVNNIIRKYAHAFEYFILSILLSNAFFMFNKKGMGAIVYILFICLFYALTDELHQLYVPGRSSSIVDVLIDFIGGMLGLSIYYVMYYKLKNRSRHILKHYP